MRNPTVSLTQFSLLQLPGCKECQTSDWKNGTHKQDCKRLQKDRKKQTIPSSFSDEKSEFDKRCEELKTIFVIGQSFTITSLTSTEGRKLNGKKCKISGHQKFHAVPSRLTVTLDENTNKHLNIRPINLEIVLGPKGRMVSDCEGETIEKIKVTLKEKEQMIELLKIGSGGRAIMDDFQFDVYLRRKQGHDMVSNLRRQGYEFLKAQFSRLAGADGSWTVELYMQIKMANPGVSQQRLNQLFQEKISSDPVLLQKARAEGFMGR